MAKTSWINRNERKRGDSQEIRRFARRAESEKGLRRPRAIAAGRQPYTGGESMRSDWPPAGFYPPLQNLAAHFSRARFARAHPWRNQIQLVKFGLGFSDAAPASAE